EGEAGAGGGEAVGVLVGGDVDVSVRVADRAHRVPALGQGVQQLYVVGVVGFGEFDVGEERAEVLQVDGGLGGLEVVLFQPAVDVGGAEPALEEDPAAVLHRLRAEQPGCRDGGVQGGRLVEVVDRVDTVSRADGALGPLPHVLGHLSFRPAGRGGAVRVGHQGRIRRGIYEPQSMEVKAFSSRCGQAASV